MSSDEILLDTEERMEKAVNVYRDELRGLRTGRATPALVESIRDLAGSFGGEVGVSAWNGFAMARFCAQDAARLRADMMAVLGRASGSALPRLWLN